MGSYVPVTEKDREEMLQRIGIDSMDDLFSMIPDDVKIKGGLDLPGGMSELQVRRAMEKMAAKNKVFPVMLRGAGAYRHFITSIVKSVISNETFLTEYTPYQAAISQGVLQSILEYQTMI